MNCAQCDEKECTTGKDCAPKVRAKVLELYQHEPDKGLVERATFIEGTYYMHLCRLAEVIEFGKQMEYKHLGIAFCIGLREEAKVLADILERHFRVSSVCCKVCGIDKQELGLTQIHDDRRESMCNPLGQAEILNEADTDLNIICGLCVGHDILFTQHSHAPVTTFLVKDRVLAHNPAGALYSGYYRRLKF